MGVVVVIILSVCATIGSGPLTMVAGPIVGEAIGGPKDFCLCVDDVMPDPWGTSLRCSLSQSSPWWGKHRKKTNCDSLLVVSLLLM